MALQGARTIRVQDWWITFIPGSITLCELSLTQRSQTWAGTHLITAEGASTRHAQCPCSRPLRSLLSSPLSNAQGPDCPPDPVVTLPSSVLPSTPPPPRVPRPRPGSPARGPGRPAGSGASSAALIRRDARGRAAPSRTMATAVR